MKHIMTIEPGINPRVRHHIENLLVELGFEVIGGGQMTDFSRSDISFERDDPRALAPLNQPEARSGTRFEHRG